MGGARVLFGEGLLRSSSERRIPHRIARFSSLGVQARKRKLQARRSCRLARDQTTSVEARTHPPRFLLYPQDSDRTTSCTACRTADARSCRVATQRPRIQPAQHAFANPAIRGHLRIPQSKSSSIDGRHDALPSGTPNLHKLCVSMLTMS